MKRSYLFSFVLLFAFLSFAAVLPVLAAEERPPYALLEGLPFIGEEGSSTTFPQYVAGAFKLAIYIVGIAALVMITIGGFWYVTSAGNSTRVSTAKSIITDAFLGLFVALFAWLILSTINPNLTRYGFTAIPGTEHLGSRYCYTNTNLILKDRQRCFSTLEACKEGKASRNDIGETECIDILTPIIVKYCDTVADQCYPTVEECSALNGGRDCVGVDANGKDVTTEPEDDRDLTPAEEADKQSHDARVEQFKEINVSTKDNYPVTSLANLHEAAYFGTVLLSVECNCDLIITGGTETTGHVSHGPGKAILDYRAVVPGDRSNFTDYMDATLGTPNTTTSDGFPVYKPEDGVFEGSTVIDERTAVNSDGIPVPHYHIEWSHSLVP